MRTPSSQQIFKSFQHFWSCNFATTCQNQVAKGLKIEVKPELNDPAKTKTGHSDSTELGDEKNGGFHGISIRSIFCHIYLIYPYISG